MLADRLSRAWDDRRGTTHLDPVMRFSDEGLVLGVGTVLASADGSARRLSIDPLEPRLAALLTAAHLRRPTFTALRHLQRAAQCRRDGDDALASMHLVLSQIDRLQQPEGDAHRLFLADSLLSAGVAAGAVIEAIEFGGAAPNPLRRRYNPDEPRVPAGNGLTSGRWTAGYEEQPDQSAEVNPGTVSTIAEIKGSYQGPEACEKALIGCKRNVKLDSWKGNANNNASGDLLDQCVDASIGCEILAILAKSPFPLGGGVLFPDGGVIIVRKGQDPTYYPREIAAVKWPNRRIRDIY